ncbi:glycosyltransferase family 2 protein [Sphingobacterium wenxiniae]|nr:glycosyltransferase family 2 protein [Sphingobacterium wenxiniae]
MNREMKISIVVPIYNAARYLAECVDSVLAQSYTNFELILVDDGSSDSSVVICRQYVDKDGRIILLEKENGGVSSARNLGLRYASGDWVAFLDADDWIEPDYLNSFLSHDNLKTDFIIQGYKRIREGALIGENGYDIPCFNNFPDFLLYSERNLLINSPWLKLFRNDIIQRFNILFDIAYDLGEDHIFTLNYLQRIRSFSVSTARGYCYRMSTDLSSLTTKVVDLDSFRQYIVESNRLREALLYAYKADNRYIVQSRQEKNKYGVLLANAVFDKRRQLSVEDERKEFNKLHGILEPKYGVWAISKKLYIFYGLVLCAYRLGLYSTKLTVHLLNLLRKFQ